MTLRPVGITRLTCFTLIILCSVVVLALEFSIDSLLDDFAAEIARYSSGPVSGGRYEWVVGHWAIGASVATLGTLIPLLILDLIRPWSLVIIELVTMAGLWLVWIISASKTTTQFIGTHCEQAYLASLFIPAFAPMCHRYTAFLAFSWTTFGLIIVYIILLVVLAFRAIAQGHKFVWFRSASRLAFSPEHTYDDKVNHV